MLDTLPLLNHSDFPAISRRKTEILQINIGLRCNQQCVHCHVNSSPKRTEKMDEATIAAVYDYLKNSDVHTLDITGGAPELHSQFRELVVKLRALNVNVIDRCNLTILSEPDQEDLAEFLAEQQVDIVASLPCYQKENVDKQRGKGVFELSVEGLQKLNRLGYGKPGSKLNLHLVYNPQGPELPPAQAPLEAAYKKTLMQDFGIEFNQLFALSNMPINRFGSTLVSNRTFHDYISLLKNSHDNDNLDGVMCRNMVSVDWQGYIYDCDFNQMLGLKLMNINKQLHIADLKNSSLEGDSITVLDHCYGCTAGQGSSCGGALG
ncbi:MAG: arsenosugar biosynthesis radical SAM protein ArsS [Gammaproteobacteria bacterium]|nr:arsenosugar biosynthesis radical SAM protein ArsS [Gammaproteobacteria bacterium]